MWDLPANVDGAGSARSLLRLVFSRVNAPADLVALLRKLRVEPAIASNDLLQFKDGRVIECRSRPTATGRAPNGRLWTFRDVTTARKTEAALREQLWLFEVLMENLPEHIYFKDRASRFTRVNSSLAHVFGVVDSGDLIGKSDYDFFTGEHAEQAYSDEQQLIEERVAVCSKEEKETWPDGRETWVLTTKLPLRDAQGRIVGTFGISRDITERKRVDALLQRDRILESVRFAAQRFLSGTAWQAVIQEVMAKIGEAACVSRVCLVERRHGPAEALAGTVLCEWTAPGVVPKSSARTEVDWSGVDWAARAASLAGAEMVTVENEANLMQSSVLARIEAGGQWFGVLCFEDSTRPRGWSDADRDCFRSVARMLGAAIARQQAQEYVDNILHSMGEALLVTDAEQLIRRVNPSALRLLEYAEEELIGQPVAKVIVEGAVQGIAVERTYRSRSGRHIPVLFSSAELRSVSHALVGFVCLAQELAERKRFEAELLRARDAAEEANRAKSTFLANMSHELRTPLNAIIGYSQMLQEDYVRPEQEHVRADLRRIELSGTLLLSIIGDILDLSKIEAGKVEMHLEQVDVAEILQEVHDAVRPLAQKQGNVLRVECCEDGGAAYADVAKLRQSVLNLVSNACKFTERGEVAVTAERVGPWTEIRVQDNGIGIEPQDVGRLFQPFTQLDGSATRKYSGTGLGLAISQKLCRMMGGEITVQSEPGKGSCFALRIPASCPEAAPAAGQV